MTRRRLDPAARRLEIVEAAERLLARAPGPVRVEDVTREAGAAKGTFYLYFPTWDDLLEAVRDRALTRFAAGAPMPAPGEAVADWASTLEGLAEAFVDFNLGLGRLHDVLFHGDFAQARPMPPHQAASAVLATLIRRGQAAGAFGPVDPVPTGRLLFAALHETADAVRDGADRERALAALRVLLRRALSPAP